MFLLQISQNSHIHTLPPFSLVTTTTKYKDNESLTTLTKKQRGIPHHMLADVNFALDSGSKPSLILQMLKEKYSSSDAYFPTTVQVIWLHIKRDQALQN